MEKEELKKILSKEKLSDVIETLTDIHDVSDTIETLKKEVGIQRIVGHFFTDDVLYCIDDDDILDFMIDTPCFNRYYDNLREEIEDAVHELYDRKYISNPSELFRNGNGEDIRRYLCDVFGVAYADKKRLNECLNNLLTKIGYNG